MQFQTVNLRAAHTACSFVEEALALGEDTDSEAFLERASANQHVDWLEANPWADDPLQTCPYDELSESEKEKDRVIVRLAISQTHKYLELLYRLGQPADGRRARLLKGAEGRGVAWHTSVSRGGVASAGLSLPRNLPSGDSGAGSDSGTPRGQTASPRADTSTELSLPPAARWLRRSSAEASGQKQITQMKLGSEAMFENLRRMGTFIETEQSYKPLDPKAIEQRCAKVQLRAERTI